MLLKWITATLFHIVISVYVDDVFIIETAEPIQSAIEIFKIVCDTIGFELETSTAHPPTAKIALLGSEISIEESRLTDKLPVRRSRGVINELRQIAQKNTLTPAHATETRGRLCFSQSLLFDRAGLSLLSAFTKRQYSKLTSRFCPPDDQIKEIFPWRVAILSCPVPIQNPPHTHPTLLYVGSSGPWRIGDEAFFDNNARVAHASFRLVIEFSRNIRIRNGWWNFRNDASECFHAWAANCGLHRQHRRDWDVSSWELRRPVGRDVASIFWSVAAHISCPVWIEQVRSKLNVADPPSRARACIPDAPTLKFPQLRRPWQLPNHFRSARILRKTSIFAWRRDRRFPECFPCPENHDAETE